MTAPVPVGPTDAQAQLREAIREQIAWHNDHFERADDALAFSIVTLPTVRDALAAQETVTAVRELHTRDATVPYACEYCGQAWPCDVIHALNTAGDL